MLLQHYLPTHINQEQAHISWRATSPLQASSAVHRKLPFIIQAWPFTEWAYQMHIEIEIGLETKTGVVSRVGRTVLW